MNTFSWLETTPLAIWISESELGYPMMIVSHSVGLAIVVGIITMLNLKVLGLFKSISSTSMQRLLPVAWAGFVLNFASGVVLFTGQASIFVTNLPFLVKISAIFLAGVNAAFLQKAMRTNSRDWDNGIAVGTLEKVLAGSSIVLWPLAITTGRLIAYV